MFRRRALALSPLLFALAACSSSSSSSATDAGSDTSPQTPPWMPSARILVQDNPENTDCRPGICQHNENTDMIAWHGALWLVHRTANSQIPGPNSSIHVYRSDDKGKTFNETGFVLAPTTPLSPDDKSTTGRDLRDPHFYLVGDTLFVKAVTRLPKDIVDGASGMDTGTDMLSVAFSTTDGAHFTDMKPIGPIGQAFWRIKQANGVYYSASYDNADQHVTLFTSTDGTSFVQGPQIYGTVADTPSETELEILPSGRMLALVRVDGTPDEVYGNTGRLRTIVCWSMPPYSSFDCPQVLEGQRLDGLVSFRWNNRLFVLARRHLQPTNKKRTALFEITGTIDGGPIDIKFVGDIPSAGDTAYSGVAFADDHTVVTSWYSGNVEDDVDWVQGMLGIADIWVGTIDLTKL